MCLEFQKLALTKWAESVIEEIRDNTQQTLESVEALIRVKLEEIQLQIETLKAEIKDLGERLSDYSDTARNIIENTRMEIRKHDADDTYVKTSAVNAATDLLRTKNLLILIGKAGIGKSSTALAIASSFHAKGIIVMKLEHNLAEDFKRYYNGEFKQLIIFDDFFGQYNVKNCSKISKDILEVLTPHVHSGMSKFIITTRTYKIEDAADEMIKCHKLFSEGVIINLNGDFNLSTTEKENILISHAIQHKINIRKKHDVRQLSTKILDDIEFEKIIGTDPYLGFPEACRLFCSFGNFFTMGFEFFASPTEELKDELGKLKRKGNKEPDDGLKYCALASLMLDTVCKKSIGIEKGIICRESHESLNNLLNLNCSMIEFLYKLLYSKEIKITTNDLHDICNQISENYITKDSDRKKYVFLHSTVRDAVLFSYWHESTMEDIITYCSVDILLEYVRTWDYVVEGCGTYVIVPMSKCTVLAQRLFDICLDCKGAIILSSIVIENSAHTLKLLNQKLTDWCSIESNVINCELSKLKKFIRPAQYKNENNRPCSHANDNWLIARLIKELPKADCQVKFVKFYIQFYGCKEFIAKFNAKLTQWLQSLKDGENCSWNVLNEFVRPTEFKIENGHIGASAKDTWIIQRVINELIKSTHGRTLHVRWYIKKYACEKFIKSFNETFSQWLKLEENFKKCSLKILFELVRPTSFTIESGKIGAYTNDNFLTQKLISELVRTRSHKFFYVKTYAKKFGSEIFVKDFNKKLTEWLQAKENMLNCDFNLLNEFVRPASFKIESGEIRAHTSDKWLIQRLFNDVQTKGVHVFSDVQSYVKKFGSDEFVIKLNKHFMEWLQSHENVMSCKLNFLYEFVRPCSFTIKNGEIGASTNDNWLTERILNVLVTSEFSKTSDVGIYIQKFGNDNFIKDINKKLANWIQSDENVKNCKLGVICNLFCPTSSKIKSGEVRAHVNDNWLSQMLLDHTIKSRSNVKYYIMKFKSNDFINNFNNKLMKWFESHENVMTCNLDVLYEFVRPSYFTIKNGEIGAITNDSWLIERIVNELVKDEAPRFSQEQSYIKKFGNDDFIRNVNKKVTEWLQFHENVINCKLIVIIAIVRPSSFRFENREIGATTNDNWLTERLLNVFVTSKRFEISDIQHYIKKFGNDDFITNFNKNLTEWFQSHENVINCCWKVLYFFCRPTAFRITCGEIIAIVNDSWLIQRLINDLESVLKTNVKHYIEDFGSEEFINNFNRRLTEWVQSEENIKNCGWITIKEFVRPTSSRIGNGEIGAFTNDNWLTQRLISELVNPDVKRALVLYVIDYIQRFGDNQFVDNFNIHLTIWLQSEEDVDKLKWDRLFKTIRPTSFKTETVDITVPITDSWIIQRLIYGLSKSEFEIGTVRQSIENYGSAENFIIYFNDKFRAWISENTKTCEWQLFKEVVKPLSYSNSSDEISVFVDDTQVVEYLFEELHQKPDVFAIKRYIQKYGSDEFILKFNKKLNMELNDVGVIKTWERLEHFYKDRYAPILLVCSSSHHKESKRDSIKWSNRFLNYSDLDFDSDCSYDDNYDLTNWNDDSEYSTYTEDVNFDSSTDSDIEGTNDDDYDDYDRRL